LIAFGEKGVSREQIMDTLWPETDGDLAHKSFVMTLIRLRQLLDNDRFIRIHGGTLMPDHRYCWVDAWAFKYLLEKIDEYKKQGTLKTGKKRGNGANEVIGLFEKALSLYKGHFLPAENNLRTMSVREQLRDKFFRVVILTGKRLGEMGEWERAAESFRKGLEIDNLCEEFYQHLMLCHNALGQQAAAVRTYEQCRSVLSRAFGNTPSQKTEEIYSAIRSNRPPAS
jgi:DNA-binding SARP family transcriptional activator